MKSYKKVLEPEISLWRHSIVKDTFSRKQAELKELQKKLIKVIEHEEKKYEKLVKVEEDSDRKICATSYTIRPLEIAELVAGFLHRLRKQ